MKAGGCVMSKEVGLMLLCVCTAVIMTGCAFGNRRVGLTPVVAEECPAAKLPTEIKVIEPEDIRGKNAHFVGYVRNGFRMHTADVISEQTVQQWVWDSLIANLRKAGYNPVPWHDNNASGISISTKISKLECDVKFRYESSMSIIVTARKDNMTVFKETYEGSAHKAIVWMNSAEYQDVLQKTMQNCVNNMMFDLIGKLENLCASPRNEQKSGGSVTNDTSKKQEGKGTPVVKENVEGGVYF